MIKAKKAQAESKITQKKTTNGQEDTLFLL